MRASGSLLKNDFDEALPTVHHGEGVYLYDTAGRRYLDGSSGAVTANLGHTHPAMVEAIREQSALVTFTHRGHLDNAPAEELAALLTEATAYPGVFLCGSGSEAVEAAMKFALQYWQERGRPDRHRFLSHAVSYHGVTLGALSLSGHPFRRRSSEALLHDFNQLTPPYAYRHAHGRTEAEFTEHLLTQADRVLAASTDVAAVVIEAVGGAAGGAITPPAGYVAGLADLCRQHDVLLVCDEVMTGAGRTGRFLACEHYGVRPDIVALGKGLGAGYAPVSAVLIGERVRAAIADGSRQITHGHTYSGNPLSAAVGVASLREVARAGLVDRAAELGVVLRAGLEELAARHPVICDVRGLGLLHALELSTPPTSTAHDVAPVGTLTHALVDLARHHGLLIYPATGGINDAVLIAPPLIANDEHILELLTLLDRALNDLTGSLANDSVDGHALTPGSMAVPR